MRKAILIALTLIMQTQPVQAVAETFTQISLSLIDSSGQPISDAQVSCGNSLWKKASPKDSAFQIVCPSKTNQSIGVLFRSNNCPKLSTNFGRTDCVPQGSFAGTIDATQNRQVTVRIPNVSQLSVKVVDAQNRPIDLNYIYGPSSWTNGVGQAKGQSDGLQWSLTSILSDQGSSIKTVRGETQFVFYGPSQISGIQVESPGSPQVVNSGPIDVNLTKSIKICVPINFGASNTMPSDCYDGNKVNDASVLASCEKYLAQTLATADGLYAEMQSRAAILIARTTEISPAVKARFKVEIERPLGNVQALQRPVCKIDASRTTLNLFESGTLNKVVDYYFQSVKARYDEYIPFLADWESRITAQLAKEKKGSVAKSKTIKCEKQGVVKRVTAVNPKCPSGYRQR